MPLTDGLSYRAELADYEEQAGALLAALRAGDEAAAWRFRWEHPRFRGRPVADVRTASLDRGDAQLVVARGYGFEGWAHLAEFTEAVRRDPAVERFEAAVEAVVDGDLATLQRLLDEHPELARSRSTRRHHATLLHYVAANGVENVRQRTPPNAVEVAKVLLAAGAEVDALADMYGTRCTTLSMLISSTPPAEAGLQAALAETLLDHGAALIGPGTKWNSALMTALAFGFLETAEALARRGAPVEDLAAAAGLGRWEDARRLLPEADGPSRNAALALAAQHGHVNVVRLLLDAGVDPNRYNRDGYHAHSTPLHQAALAGHGDVVRLLVERAARLDLRDTIYRGTPLDWAEYRGREEVAEFLRDRGSDGISKDVEGIPFYRLPLWVRIAAALTLLNTWILIAEFVIDRYGLDQYLPFYRYGDVCLWDIGVIAGIAVLFVRGSRALDQSER